MIGERLLGHSADRHDVGSRHPDAMSIKPFGGGNGAFGRCRRLPSHACLEIAGESSCDHRGELGMDVRAGPRPTVIAKPVGIAE